MVENGQLRSQQFFVELVLVDNLQEFLVGSIPAINHIPIVNPELTIGERFVLGLVLEVTAMLGLDFGKSSEPANRPGPPPYLWAGVVQGGVDDFPHPGSVEASANSASGVMATHSSVREFVMMHCSCPEQLH